MGNAFTPGLLVTPRTTIRKIRKLPIGGEATVTVGQAVEADSIVASAEHQGNLVVVRASDILEIDPTHISNALHCREGDIVREGQLLGEIRHLFGLIRNECLSPVNGYVETISLVTGHISVREPAALVEVKAYINGEIIEVTKTEVVIETAAGIVQGIFGLGGERNAPIAVISREADITPDTLSPEYANMLVVGGASISTEAITRAVDIGVAGIVVGSIEHQVLDFILGEPIGVAITGQEDIGFTLIVTEGFGKLRMAERTFSLLQSFEGRSASFNGTTQIRAGVVRPEVVIPLAEVPETAAVASLAVAQELQIGSHIRIIRAPFFGALARVTDLPEQPVAIETETEIRVLTAQCDNGQTVTVPRANVEIIT